MAGRTWVELEGIGAAISRYTEIRTKVMPAMVSPMIIESEMTMTLAKRLTPVDTGRLRGSGRVNPPSISATRIVITMGFYTEYAVYVHEDLNAFHPVGQAKFLEVAVNQRISDIERRLTAAMRKALSP